MNFRPSTGLIFFRLTHDCGYDALSCSAHVKKFKFNFTIEKYQTIYWLMNIIQMTN